MMMETNQNENASSSSQSTDSQPNSTTLPAVKKVLKPEVQQKLLKRAVLDIVPENPIGALHALFEKDSFSLAFSDNNQVHKAVLRIDGRVFQKVSTQKRKARDGVVIEALEYLFADTIAEMRRRYSAAIEHPFVMVSSVPPPTVANSAPKVATKTHRPSSSERDSVCAKKIKHDVPAKADQSTTNKEVVDESAASKTAACATNKIPQSPFGASERPPVKKELKPVVVERLVQQALGLLECENPNTVTALFSLFEKDVFDFQVVQVSQTDHSNPKFQANLRVGDRHYTDSAISIKKAKSNATKKALRDLFPEYAGPEPYDDASEDCKTNAKNGCDGIGANVMNGHDVSGADEPNDGPKAFSFADFIADTVQSKYNEIVEEQPDHLRRYSVLSGIVMIQNNDFSTATVISVSTGSATSRIEDGVLILMKN